MLIHVSRGVTESGTMDKVSRVSLGGELSDLGSQLYIITYGAGNLGGILTFP